MNAPTVKERLKVAQNTATLMKLALAADADEAGLDLQDVVNALQPQADRLDAELYWLGLALGEAVLNLPAPTDDEREAWALRQADPEAAGAEIRRVEAQRSREGDDK